MSIESAIERAANELPPGCELRICVENGAGYVEGYDSGGYLLAIESADRSIEEQIIDGLEEAKDIESLNVE